MADVTLLLEGTYPYVHGGVSAWVHQLIRGLPELRFSIFFIGGAREAYGEPRYMLPPNVVRMEQHFLAPAPGEQAAGGRWRGNYGELTAWLDRVHGIFRQRPDALDPAALQAVAGNLRHAGEGLLVSDPAWEFICRQYRKNCPDESFLNYLWTIRSTHAPLFSLARALAKVPPGRCYHAVSTGFAGLAGALVSSARQRPFLLTEHGIYTKERTIELQQADWLGGREPEPGKVGYLRQLWIRLFEAMGKLTYLSADPIIALYEQNRARQIRDGAPAERTRVIPNGVDVPRLAELRARRRDAIPPVLALVGRVVPIKDIKTFIRAVRLVCSEMPEARGWVVGPTDEDPAYARECRELSASMDLEGRLEFCGFRSMEQVLPEVGVLMLSSISEAQPLVLLEGFAAGVPCVATDVGCCRDIIEGTDAADRRLGTAGVVTSIADPETLGRAALGLLRDPTRWRAAQAAAIARVESRYTQARMLRSYQDLYLQAMGR